MIALLLHFLAGFVVGALVAWAVRAEIAGRDVARGQIDAFAIAKSSSPSNLEDWRAAVTPPAPYVENLIDPRPWESLPEYEDAEVDDESDASYVIVTRWGGTEGFGRETRIPRETWNTRWGIKD